VVLVASFFYIKIFLFFSVANSFQEFSAGWTKKFGHRSQKENLKKLT